MNKKLLFILFSCLILLSGCDAEMKQLTSNHVLIINSVVFVLSTIIALYIGSRHMRLISSLSLVNLILLIYFRLYPMSVGF